MVGGPVVLDCAEKKLKEVDVSETDEMTLCMPSFFLAAGLGFPESILLPNGQG
jgi:hypothetical protein